MATILTALGGPARWASFFCTSILFLLPGSALGETARPVAFYDGELVVARAAASVGEDVRLARLVERHAAETAQLRGEVDALRVELVHSVTLPEPARRDIETRLAHGTIALLVAETEGAREIEVEQARLAERLEQGVAAVVARVAQERGLPVVVRAGADTVVLDPDAVDITDEVLAALGGPTGAAPEVEPLPERARRVRLQACAPPADATAALAR